LPDTGPVLHISGGTPPHVHPVFPPATPTPHPPLPVLPPETPAACSLGGHLTARGISAEASLDLQLLPQPLWFLRGLSRCLPLGLSHHLRPPLKLHLRRLLPGNRPIYGGQLIVPQGTSLHISFHASPSMAPTRAPDVARPDPPSVTQPIKLEVILLIDSKETVAPRIAPTQGRNLRSGSIALSTQPKVVCQPTTALLLPPAGGPVAPFSAGCTGPPPPRLPGDGALLPPPKGPLQ
jgi:hypothetical protein